jgi:hypothetical protein
MDFLSDPKNRPYVIAGTVAILVLAGVLIWKVMGRGGTTSAGLPAPPAGQVVPGAYGAGTPGTVTPGTVTPGTATPGTGAPSGPMTPPGGGAAPPASPGGQQVATPPSGPAAGPAGGATSMPPAVGAAPAAPATGTQVAMAKPLPSRSDPFQRVEGQKSYARLSLPRVMVRKKEAQFTSEVATTEQEAPTTEKRMAGIIWDGGIAAILVDQDKSYVVRPGDVIGNMKVMSIRRSSLTLQIGRDRQEEVFLRPAVPGLRRAAAAPPTVGPGYGPGVPPVPPVGPGGPVIGPGGPGRRPGRPGGGGGGGGGGRGGGG